MTASADLARQETELLIHAYMDGELDPVNALAVKQQIDADPALASELAAVSELQRVPARTVTTRPCPGSFAVANQCRRRADTPVGPADLARAGGLGGAGCRYQQQFDLVVARATACPHHGGCNCC